MDITSISTQARALQRSTAREHSLAAIKKHAAADKQPAARPEKPAASLPKPSSEYNFSVYV